MHRGTRLRLLAVLWSMVATTVVDRPLMGSDPESTDLTALQGVWLLQSTEYGGKESVSKGQLIWKIVDNQLTQSVRREKEVFGLKIYPTKRPRGIDLIPREQGDGASHELRIQRKCIYSLERDEKLKVAVTYQFVPGAPEDEKQRAIENAMTRPKDFETKRGDVLIMTFTRHAATKEN